MASLDGLNNNITNNINTIDGLTTLYSNGQPISSGNYVPYTGANAMVDLGSQEIKTTYSPTTGADLINKTYGDATYATQTGILAYVPYSGALGDVNLNGKRLTNGGLLVNQGSSPTASFSVDSSGNIFMPSLGTSGFLQLGTSGQVSSGAAASLTAGTFGSRQSFSGYNKFLAELQVSSLNFTLTPAFGSVSYFLAIDSTGSVIASSGSGASLTAGTLGSPQQFSGYNQFLAQLIVNTLLFSATPPSGTAAFYLGVDSGNNLITTSSIGASLTAGTLLSPQQFSGYNQFLSPLKISGVSFSSAPTAGSSTTILALDGANNVITTTISTAPPTQINVTSTLTSAPYFFTLINANSSGVKTIYTDGNGVLNYNPSTGTLNCANFIGLATQANNANNIYTGTTTTNATFYLTFAQAFSGTQQQLNVNNTLTFNPSTNILTVTNLTGTSLTTTSLTSSTVDSGTVNTDFIYPLTSGGALQLNSPTNVIQFRIGSTVISSVNPNGISSTRFNGSGTTATLINSNEATYGAINFQKGQTTHCTLQLVNPSFSQLVSNTGLSLNAGGANNALNLGTNGGHINLYPDNYLMCTITRNGIYTQTDDIYIDSNYFANRTENTRISFPSGSIYNTFLSNENQILAQNIKNSGTWNDGNYCVFTSVKSRSGTTPGLGVWGGSTTAGICSLSPGLTWQPLHLIGGPIYAWNTSVLGSTLTSTGWANSSDRRFKKNIRPIKTTRSLERVLAVKPCTYNMIYDEGQCPISDKLKNQPCLGFIAQEIAESNPHCIHEIEDKNEIRFALQYNDYVVHLCGAVQEQQTLILKNQSELLNQNLVLVEQQKTILAQAEEIQSLKSDLLTLHQSLTSVINILNKNKLS